MVSRNLSSSRKKIYFKFNDKTVRSSPTAFLLTPNDISFVRTLKKRAKMNRYLIDDSDSDSEVTTRYFSPLKLLHKFDSQLATTASNSLYHLIYIFITLLSKSL